MSLDKKFTDALDELTEYMIMIAKKYRLSPFEVGLLLELFAHSSSHVLIGAWESAQES